MIYYSKLLKKRYKINSDSGNVKFDDGTIYTHAEYKGLKSTDKEIIIALHQLKEVFGGTIGDEI